MINPTIWAIMGMFFLGTTVGIIIAWSCYRLKDKIKGGEK